MYYSSSYIYITGAVTCKSPPDCGFRVADRSWVQGWRNLPLRHKSLGFYPWGSNFSRRNDRQWRVVP